MSLLGKAPSTPSPEMTGEDAAAKSRRELDHCLANGFVTRSEDGKLNLLGDANVGHLLPIPLHVIALMKDAKQATYLRRQNDRFMTMLDPLMAREATREDAAETARSLMTAEIAKALGAKLQPQAKRQKQNPTAPVPATEAYRPPKPTRQKTPTQSQQQIQQIPLLFSTSPPTTAASSPTAENPFPLYHQPTGAVFTAQMAAATAYHRQLTQLQASVVPTQARRHRMDNDLSITFQTPQSVDIVYDVFTQTHGSLTMAPVTTTIYYYSQRRMVRHLLELYRFRIEDDKGYYFEVRPVGRLSRILPATEDIPFFTSGELSLHVTSSLTVIGASRFRVGLAERIWTRPWEDRFQHFQDTVRDILDGAARPPVWMSGARANKAINDLCEIKTRSVVLFTVLTEFIYGTTHAYTHFRLMHAGFYADNIAEEMRLDYARLILVEQQEEPEHRSDQRSERQTRRPWPRRTGTIPELPELSRHDASPFPSSQRPHQMQRNNHRPPSPTRSITPPMNTLSDDDEPPAQRLDPTRLPWTHIQSSIRAEMGKIPISRLRPHSEPETPEMFPARYTESDFNVFGKTPYVPKITCLWDPLSVPDLSRPMTYRDSISNLEELTLLALDLPYKIKICVIEYEPLGEPNPIEQVRHWPIQDPSGAWYINYLSKGSFAFVTMAVLNQAMWRVFKQVEKENRITTLAKKLQPLVGNYRDPREVFPIYSTYGKYLKAKVVERFEIASPFLNSEMMPPVRILLNKKRMAPHRLQMASIKDTPNNPNGPFQVTPVYSILTFLTNGHNRPPSELYETTKNRWTKEPDRRLTDEEATWVRETARALNQARTVYEAPHEWPTAQANGEPIYDRT